MPDSEKTTTTTTTTAARPTVSIPAISSLKFPFKLTKDQLEAVDAWISNGYKGSIIYSTGTGKTEIAFECARRAAEAIIHTSGSNVFNNDNNDRNTTYTLSQNNSNSNDNANNKNSFNILFLVPRIILVEQNIKRLAKYGISQEHIGAYFGERKEVLEITISTYQ